MPRKPAPWHRASTGWWMAWIDKKQVKLVEGPDDEACRKRAYASLGEKLRMKALAPEPESGGATVASVIDQYLDYAKPRLSERSLYERRIILQAFAEAHGFRKADDKHSLPLHLTGFVDGNPNWKSDWTKAQVSAVVQRPFNWAVRQRLIAANPYRGVSYRDGDPRRPMTDEEFAKLVVAAEGRKTKKRPTPGERFVEFLRFLRSTGARTAEAGRLTWADVDLEGRAIVLKKHKTSSTQRKRKPRVIPLTSEVAALLIEIKGRGEPGDHVFLNHRRTPWNRSNLSLRMRRAREKSGVPDDAKLYGLRHRFATKALVNGVDIKTLAELLGHTTTRMTEHYLAALGGETEHLHDAMKRAVGEDPEKN